MGHLFSWTTGLILAGFWILCVLDAFFWHWTTDTFTERFDDYTLWIRKNIAAGGYYTSAALLGAVFYSNLFLPTLSTPPVAPRRTVPPAALSAPNYTPPVPVQIKDGHFVPTDY